jgi:hypothetical protein
MCFQQTGMFLVAVCTWMNASRLVSVVDSLNAGMLIPVRRVALKWTVM